MNKSEEPSAWVSLVFGILVSLIGGVVVSLIVKEGRFAPQPSTPTTAVDTIWLIIGALAVLLGTATAYFISRKGAQERERQLIY